MDSINIIKHLYAKYILQTYLGNPSFKLHQPRLDKANHTLQRLCYEGWPFLAQKGSFLYTQIHQYSVWRLPSPQKVEWHLRIFLGQSLFFCFGSLAISMNLTLMKQIVGARHDSKTANLNTNTHTHIVDDEEYQQKTMVHRVFTFGTGRAEGGTELR